MEFLHYLIAARALRKVSQSSLCIARVVPFYTVSLSLYVAIIRCLPTSVVIISVVTCVASILILTSVIPFSIFGFGKTYWYSQYVSSILGFKADMDNKSGL